MSPERKEWELDPEADARRREARLRNEKARFFPGAPPQPSVMGELNPPYCPVRTGFIGIPVSERIVVAGQKQVSVQVQAQQFPCMADKCLWWDRGLSRCGVTSLLEYMAAVEEDDDAEQGEAQTEASGGDEISPA